MISAPQKKWQFFWLIWISPHQNETAEQVCVVASVVAVLGKFLVRRKK